MISTKGRYALRVMIDLAKHDNGQPVPLKDIAERQEISKKYLEIIVKELVDGKMVKGASGKGGLGELAGGAASVLEADGLLTDAADCLDLRRNGCGGGLAGV